jgi:hypothetical protein
MRSPPITGRISALSDYYGKTRIIAIGDYYSQRVLKPLGEELLRLIKKLSGDATHDLDAVIGRIKKLQESNVLM